MKLSNEQLKTIYEELKEYHEKYLKKYGVTLPNLTRNNQYSKYALVLIYLYKNYQKKVTKDELTNFIAEYYGERPNDVQQARHLGAQKGWYIISGTRNDVECERFNVNSGEYALISLTEPYPNFTNLRRSSNLNEDEWENIKKEYDYRCATCGSKEGEKNFHYNSITRLQKGHMDPNKPLELGNIIPQCSECNRQDRNYFIFNKKGRVIKIADPRFVLKSNESTQKAMYNLLKDKFN